MLGKKRAEYIVLSRGQSSALRVPSDLVRDLEAKGFKVIVEPTKVAMQKYNDLVTSGKTVAGLFHTTC